MNIGNMIKAFILSMIAVVAPYLLKALLKVVLPIIVKSLSATMEGTDAAIQKAKAEVKANWGSYINEAQTEAAGTQSIVDDVIFGYLANTQADDAFIASVFDKAVKFEQQFFRPAQGGNPAAAPAPAK